MSGLAPFAEIIESSLHTFQAQCWHWNQPPLFGSLVTVTNDSQKIFGVVYGISTGSLDPSRIPIVFQKTEAELQRDQPQIFTLLRTNFECLILGYETEKMLRYQFAPKPPKMHAFVRPATVEEYQSFFTSEQYINVIFGATHPGINLDELLLALLQQQAAHNALDQERLKKLIQSFSLLTGNDYRRLKLFLQRVSHNVQLNQ